MFISSIGICYVVHFFIALLLQFVCCLWPLLSLLSSIFLFLSWCAFFLFVCLIISFVACTVSFLLWVSFFVILPFFFFVFMPFPCCYVYNCSVVLQMCFFMICVMVWLKHFIFLNWWYVCSFGFVYLAFLFLVLLMFPLFIFVSPCWNMFLVAAFVLLHISSMRLCLKGSYLFCAKGPVACPGKSVLSSGSSGRAPGVSVPPGRVQAKQSKAKQSKAK